MEKYTLRQMITVMKIGGPIEDARIPIPDRIIDDGMVRKLAKYATDYDNNIVLKALLVKTNDLPALNKNEARTMFYKLLASGKITREVKSLLVEKVYNNLFMNLYDDQYLNVQADIIPMHFLLLIPVSECEQLITSDIMDLICVKSGLYDFTQESFLDLIIKLVHSNLSADKYSEYHMIYKRILEVTLDLYGMHSIKCPLSFDSYRLLCSLKCAMWVNDILIMSGVSPNTMSEYDLSHRKYVHDCEVRKLERQRIYKENEAKRKIELRNKRKRDEEWRQRQIFLRKQEELEYKLKHGRLRYAKQNEPVPHTKSGGRDIGFNESTQTRSPIKIYGYCTFDNIYTDF